MGNVVTYSEGKLTILQELYLNSDAKRRREEERTLDMFSGNDKMNAENFSSQEPAAVLVDEKSVKDIINMGSLPEGDLDRESHDKTDVSEVLPEADSSETSNKTMTDSTKSGSEDAEAMDKPKEAEDVLAGQNADVQALSTETKGGVYSDKVPIVSYASKPKRLANITLGREPRSAYFVLSKRVTLDCGGIIKSRDGSWEYEQVTENGEDKIRFTPFKEGEHVISVSYNGGKTLTFHLTVNPDPWSLWTIEEIDEKEMVFPTDKDRIARNHKDVIAEEYPGLKVIGASRRGRSHERSGTFRDDDMGVWADTENGNYVFIVSDGAGSCRFSREGARIAISFISKKLESNKVRIEEAWAKSKNIEENRDCPIGMTLTRLALLARKELVDYVKANEETHPDWKVKDFSGTLLVAALKREKSGALQLVTLSIGDGAIAWYLGGGKHGLMCCPDSGEFGGGTRFLTTPEVWKAMSESKTNEDTAKAYKDFCKKRVFCKTFTPDEAKKFQLFLMSDGVSDPWFETDARLENGDVWRQFAEDTLTSTGDNKAGLVLADYVKDNAEKLWEWLYFKKVGNHDDRTIIVVYSTEENEISSEKKEA